MSKATKCTRVDTDEVPWAVLAFESHELFSGFDSAEEAAAFLADVGRLGIVGAYGLLEQLAESLRWGVNKIDVRGTGNKSDCAPMRPTRVA